MRSLQLLVEAARLDASAASSTTSIVHTLNAVAEDIVVNHMQHPRGLRQAARQWLSLREHAREEHARALGGRGRPLDLTH
jgi:hypothetical protein